jgi:hypothetical protein
MQLKHPTKTVNVLLNPQRQTMKQVQDLVAKLGGLAGCLECGRIAYLDIHFLGDPDPGFKDLGAISIGQQGF